MGRIAALLAAAVSMCAGTIRGVVVERASGRPVARTVVRLDPVPKSDAPAGQHLITRAGRSGHFIFPVVAPGLYLLTATRAGYFNAAYGQRLPSGRGTPLAVTADSDLFTDLRLRQKGAITGRVLDENGVGAGGVDVVAYPARLPLRAAGTGTSDDRGIYRIHGLAPGKYWVRSAAHTLEDGSGWLPTFGPQGREVRDARMHHVTVDADTPDADVNPEPGMLFHLAGTVGCELAGVFTVTLSSETERRTTQAHCRDPYRFEGLAPGVYEVFASSPDGAVTGFIELALGESTDAANIAVLPLPSVNIEIRRTGSNTPPNIPVTLTGRRQDLSEAEPAREIKGPRTSLAPSYWEFRAQVPAGQYVESIVNLRNAPRRAWKAERPADWFDVFIEPRSTSTVCITVADSAGRISGRVLSAENKPVPGVPVFLWPVEETARRQLSGPLQLLSDTEGRFSAGNLPPGDYRVLPTFDVPEVDEEVIELSRAMVVRAAAAQTTTVDVPLWIAP